MFELYKRDRQVGSYSSYSAAKIAASRMRGEQRAQRFTIRGPKGQEWHTMLPPQGAGRAKWEPNRN